MTLLVLVFSEITPKSIAKAKAEKERLMTKFEYSTFYILKLSKVRQHFQWRAAYRRDEATHHLDRVTDYLIVLKTD